MFFVNRQNLKWEQLQKENEELKFKLSAYKERWPVREKYLEQKIKILQSDLDSAKVSLSVEKREKEKLIDNIYSYYIDIKFFEALLSVDAKKIIKQYTGPGQTYENVLAEIINTYFDNFGSEKINLQLAQVYRKPHSYLLSIREATEHEIYKHSPQRMTVEEFNKFRPASPGEYIIQVMNDDKEIVATKIITFFSH